MLTSDLFTSKEIAESHNQLTKDYYSYWNKYHKKYGKPHTSGARIPIHTPASNTTLTEIEHLQINLLKNLQSHGYESLKEFGKSEHIIGNGSFKY